MISIKKLKFEKSILISLKQNTVFKKVSKTSFYS